MCFLTSVSLSTGCSKQTNLQNLVSRTSESCLQAPAKLSNVNVLVRHIRNWNNRSSFLMTEQLLDRYKRMLRYCVFLKPANYPSDTTVQHDSARPYNKNVVTQPFNHEPSNRCMLRRGSFTWPPRSLDLAPCKFFLWVSLELSERTSILQGSWEFCWPQGKNGSSYCQ